MPQFSRRTERPTETAARNTGQYHGGRSDQNIAAGGSPTYSIVQNNGDRNLYLLSSSVEVLNGDYTDVIGIRVTVNASDGSTLYQIAGNAAGWPQILPDGIPIPPGGSATVRVTNPTAAAIDVRIAHSWREEVAQ